jgi:ketosteroid isomerase-like protein
MYSPMRAATQVATADLAQSNEACPLNADELPTRRWIDDMREKNLADVTALLTTDIVFVDPGEKTFRGLTDVQRLYAQVFATFDSKMTFDRPVLYSGRAHHVCIEKGDYQEDLRDRNTGMVSHYSGRYRFVYRHVPKLGWCISRQEWTVSDQEGRDRKIP